uniref:Uncharacterized protein n=1 Tax=Nomascus leucogenys TaxID=61853 RepID=A0A2I3FWA5_NOMLE
MTQAHYVTFSPRFQQKMRNIPRRLAENVQQPLFSSCPSLMRAFEVTRAGHPGQFLEDLCVW